LNSIILFYFVYKSTHAVNFVDTKQQVACSLSTTAGFYQCYSQYIY